MKEWASRLTATVADTVADAVAGVVSVFTEVAPDAENAGIFSAAVPPAPRESLATLFQQFSNLPAAEYVDPAIRQSYAQAAERYLKRDGKLDELRFNSVSPLAFALAKGDIAAANWFLAHGARSFSSLDRQAPAGRAYGFDVTNTASSADITGAVFQHAPHTTSFYPGDTLPPAKSTSAAGVTTTSHLEVLRIYTLPSKQLHLTGEAREAAMQLVDITKTPAARAATPVEVRPATEAEVNHAAELQRAASMHRVPTVRGGQSLLDMATAGLQPPLPTAASSNTLTAATATTPPAAKTFRSAMSKARDKERKLKGDGHKTSSSTPSHSPSASSGSDSGSTSPTTATLQAFPTRDPNATPLTWVELTLSSQANLDRPFSWTGHLTESQEALNDLYK